MQIKHLEYIQKSKAQRELKQLYEHIELSFGKLAEPFVLHSLNKELTAGVWAILFETLLVEGKVKRSLKEVIATAVSEINKCNYCVDAHSIMILGTEKNLYSKILSVKEVGAEPKTKEDNTILWALQNLDFDSQIILNPPFSKEEAPEIIGTAVLFHYINRMVSLYAGETPLPSTKMRGILIKLASDFIFAKAIKKEKKAGESLRFIDENFYHESIAHESLNWADGTPNIHKAFQYFKHHTDHKIDQILSLQLIASLNDLSKKTELLQQDFGCEELENFLAKVESSEREMAEFCYLTIFKPHKVYDKHFQALKQDFKDEEILQASAFVSMLVAENIGKELFNS